MTGAFNQSKILIPCLSSALKIYVDMKRPSSYLLSINEKNKSVKLISVHSK